jgi:lysophospholipase L1-like esterase
VFVLGDSVTLGTASTVPIRLSDWLVTYDAEASRRLAQGIDTLAARRGEIGEAVVVQLGNNYIDGERGDYASQIDEAMTVLVDVPRVVWVTVSEVSPSRVVINESIRAAAERHRNMWVADWATVIASEPGMSWDGIHLTPLGRQRMADVVAAALGPVVP